MKYCEYLTPIGVATLGCEDGALIGLWLSGQRHFPDAELKNAEPDPSAPTLVEAKRWLDRYFAGERPSADELVLAPRGTPFRCEVWRELTRIEYGDTCSYGELARRLGSSPRAVGGAVGHNPISIIIPCHRVIGASGALVGYDGGLDRKLFLLRHEGCADFQKSLDLDRGMV